MLRLCLKSMPAIGYRRLIWDYLEPRNGLWYQNIFACTYRGYFYRFKSTKPGLFKSLSETVAKKNQREDVKLTDAKSIKLEEDKKLLLLNKNKSDGHLNLNVKSSVENYQKNERRKPKNQVKKIENHLFGEEDLFVNFQELLTLPQKNLFKNDPKLNVKRTMVKESVKVKKKTGSKKNKILMQPLVKNKKDPKIYENLNLLKIPEPQCDFLDLQSGKKRIFLSGVSDFSHKTNLQNTRTMASSADRGIYNRKSPRKKIERLENRLLLETPKIKAIKNRLSKMDRYWLIAAKKKRESKIPEAIMILRDRIRQQIEASKTFKYPLVMVEEPVKLAMVGDDGNEGRRSEEKGEVIMMKRDDNSSKGVLEKVKIMNRKLKDTPYIPPVVDRKKFDTRKSSGGKFYLKKMKKKKIEKVPEVRKTEEKPVKLYSEKIREKIMKLEEKYKAQSAETQVQEAQEAPQQEVIESVENPPEVIAEAPKIEEVPEEPKIEVPDDPPKPKQKFPFYSHRIPVLARGPSPYTIRPYARPEESPQEGKPAMTLSSAMEGFNLNSDVQRIILKAKAKAMGVRPPPEEIPPAKDENKKKEIVRKSTFFSLKHKKKLKAKESIMSVDKTDTEKLEEVVKRTRVPVRIPEYVAQSPTSADPCERPPTQEETARKIRKWFLYGRTGEDPKPIVEKKSNDVEINKTSGKESPLPTLEKIHPKKEEIKVKKGIKSNEKVSKTSGKMPKKVASLPSGLKSQQKVQETKSEVLMVDQETAQEILMAPSGFRSPRPPKTPDPKRERKEKLSEPPKEPTTPQEILDPTDGQKVSAEPSGFRSPRPPKTPDPKRERREKISEPPKEPKTPQEILDSTDGQKVSAEPSGFRSSRPPKTPETKRERREKISEPPKEPKAPQEIADPTDGQKVSAEPSGFRSPRPPKTPDQKRERREKISEPPKESKAPQEIVDPTDGQKISAEPSGFRSPKPPKPSDPKRERREKISEPPSEPRTPQEIVDPTDERQISTTPSGFRSPRPPKTPDPKIKRRAPEKISDPPTEPILDPKDEPNAPQPVSAAPSGFRTPRPPVKDPRMPQEPPRTPPKIIDPPSEPQKISDPLSEPRPPPSILDEPTTPQKISDPLSEPRTPQKISDPSSKPPQKNPDQRRTPEKISDPPREPRTSHEILDPPKEPQPISAAPSGFRTPQPPQAPGPMRVPRPPKEPSIPPVEPRTPQISDPPSDPKPPPSKMDPLDNPRIPQKIPEPPQHKPPPLPPKVLDPIEPRTPQKISDAPLQPKPASLPPKISDPPKRMPQRERISDPTKDPRKAQKIFEPPSDYRVWVPSDESFKKKLAESTKPEKIEPKKEFPRDGRKYTEPKKPDTRTSKKIEMPTRKETIQIPRKPKMEITKKPERVAKAKAEPAKKVVVEVVKSKEIPKIERKVEAKPKVTQMSAASGIVDHVAASAKIEAVEVAKPKEFAKIDWEPEFEQLNVQNLPKVDVKHETPAVKMEPPIPKVVEVAKPEEKLSPTTAEAEEITKLKEILSPEKKTASERIDVQNFANENVQEATRELEAVMKHESASEIQAKIEKLLNKDLPKVEEVIKPEEKDIPYPKPVLAIPEPPRIHNIISTPPPEIAKSLKNLDEDENEPEVLKGAINIKLKPLSEIERLTKTPGNLEKVEDAKRSPGIDELEKIISKKIETIPCVKPKLPPYYYTPYSSSTVEPEEELPNKKKDKTDEK